jgi:glycosyltransferase involved in cell wall biosynthesis
LSLAEGIPVALMEAASFGITMLATSTVGNPEIVNEENGFLIDINFDSQVIATKLDNYFSNQKK